jgi:hypothetical protein
MSMRISTRGFKEAVVRLNELGDVPQTQKFRDMLVTALEPIREAAVGNVHSISGKTASAIVVSAGKGTSPSAYVKVDRKVATALWKGRQFAYPYAVEYGHGGPHPAVAHPFFMPAVESGRSEVRSIVNDGAEELLRPYTSPVGIGGEFS